PTATRSHRLGAGSWPLPQDHSSLLALADCGSRHCSLLDGLSSPRLGAHPQSSLCPLAPAPRSAFQAQAQEEEGPSLSSGRPIPSLPPTIIISLDAMTLAVVPCLGPHSCRLPLLVVLWSPPAWDRTPAGCHCLWSCGRPLPGTALLPVPLRSIHFK